MDAQESVIAIVDPEDVLYIIKVTKNGQIDRSNESPNGYKFNSVLVNRKMFAKPNLIECDDQIITFLNAKSVQEPESSPNRQYNRTSSALDTTRNDSNKFGRYQKNGWVN